jgi:hypothetical protein
VIPPFPRFDPADGVTILEPGGTGAGHWVGCPGVTWDPVRKSVLLTYRKRRPRGGELPDRGWECCVAESRDGIRFTDLWSIRKEQLGSTSLERFCLRRTDDGLYLLYTSYEHPDDGRWRIDVLEADAPDAFDVARARTVLTPAGTGTAAVKDPYVVRAGPGWLMYVSTFVTDDGPAPTFLAVSADGISYRWLGEVFPVGDGWDGYQARLSAIVPWGGGFVGLYDGTASAAEDTEERLGVAVSFDLRSWLRVSVDEPWLVSPDATGSLRYADGLVRDGELWLYYEAARADGSHDLRLSRLPLPA